MTDQPAALVADRSQEFRESLVNHLLVMGFERVIEVQNRRDIVHLLPSMPRGLVVIDFELFCDPEVNRIVRHHQLQRRSWAIITLSDERLQSDFDSILESDLHLCVLKSTARRILAQLVCQ